MSAADWLHDGENQSAPARINRDNIDDPEPVLIMQ